MYRPGRDAPDRRVCTGLAGVAKEVTFVNSTSPAIKLPQNQYNLKKYHIFADLNVATQTKDYKHEKKPSDFTELYCHFGLRQK